ncbi:hypothetical protein BH10PSE11_BH10PSE11_41110 [soil metagenome]
MSSSRLIPPFGGVVADCSNGVSIVFVAIMTRQVRVDDVPVMLHKKTAPHRGPFLKNAWILRYAIFGR